MARKVYFAFHYQDVMDFRANVVRNHNVTKGVESAGYYDYSIWEESEKKGDLAIKRMINAELEGTSVTVILIGSETYARRWVRYEILKSMSRGNLLLGIHINNIPGKNDRETKPKGENPFDYLGLSISDDGKKAKPTEWSGSQWVYYSDLEPFEISMQPEINRGKNFQLSHWYRTYDWVIDDGYNNFSKWIG